MQTYINNKIHNNCVKLHEFFKHYRCKFWRKVKQIKNMKKNINQNYKLILENQKIL